MFFYKEAYRISKGLFAKNNKKEQKLKIMLLACFVVVFLFFEKVLSLFQIKTFKQRKIIKKYKGIKLAVRNYKSKNNAYFVKDFSNFEDLLFVLGEVSSHETDLRSL